MRASFISALASASVSFVFVSSAVAQDNSTCNSEYLTFYNASGSVSTPGFRVNDTYEETTWTWTRYVADVDEESNKSNVLQTLGLETSPLLDLLDAESLPYTGCVFALTELSGSAAGKGENDDGTCTSVFGSDCVDEIISVVNASAARLSGTVAGSSDTLSCPTLLTGLSDGCRELWSATISAQFLPNNFTSNASSACNNTVNPGNSNATSSAFFGWAARGSTDQDNFTEYDNAILTPGPIIVATWLKDTSNDTADPSATVTNNGWADTRLLCLPANITEAGSRNITQAQKESGGRNVRAGGFVLTASIIVVALMI